MFGGKVAAGIQKQVSAQKHQLEENRKKLAAMLAPAEEPAAESTPANAWADVFG